MTEGKYQAYPEYQNSGIKWFGQVPKEWISSRLKFESLINMGQSPSSDDCNQDGFGLPFLQGNAEFGIKSPSPKQYCEVSKKIANKGDFLFSVRAPVGALNLADQDYGIGRGLCSIKNNEGLSPDFLWWLIPVVRSELDSVSTGSTFEAVSAEQVENVLIFKPSIFEQRKIANFLDHETAKIDTLIEKQQQLIKLLKEKRQAVISHAVTKGLNPDVPMRDSGVEWLGEVPEHWLAPKVRYVAKLESGHTPSRNKPEYWRNCHIPWISLGDVWQLRSGRQKYISKTKETISELGLENSAARLLPKNTVILSRTASVGFAGIMKQAMATTQDFANWVCGEKLHPEFLLYSFWAMESEFDRLMVGSTHKTIYMPDIKELFVSLPPIDEQLLIIQLLNKKLPSFDVLESKSVDTIKLLKERRTALISAAVTGKIDVRNWQPPKPVPNEAEASLV